MAELIEVSWEADAPFFRLIERLIGRQARRWGGESGEALGDVWDQLRTCFHVGEVIDPWERKRHIGTIVSRKVNNYFSRREKPLQSRAGWVSLSEVAEPSQAQGLRIDFSGGQHFEEVVGIECADHAFRSGAPL